jgi:uncharacterized membrane protein
MTDVTRRRLRYAAIALAAAGLLVAAYLTFTHVTESNFLCSETGGCNTVRSSRYSELVGIPVALLGLIGYGAILGLLVYENAGGARAAAFTSLATFGLTSIGALYSAYLTYLELFVIGAICPYCAASAIIMLALFAIALIRVIYDEEPLEGESTGE